MNNTRPVLLVHGAWHGAWCWSATQAALDQLGVPSWAIDLPGHGLSSQPLADLAEDAACVRRALDSIKRATGNDAVLVGHSYGGGVITEAAARHLDDGGNVAHLVYLTAAALADGESVGALAAQVNGTRPGCPNSANRARTAPSASVLATSWSRCSTTAVHQQLLLPRGPGSVDKLSPA